MKMKIGTALPEDYELSHSDLSDAMITLVAHALLPMFEETMPEKVAKANVEGIVTELAYVLDEGSIEIGGKTYRPRLAFVDDTGEMLPGATDMNQLHELVEDLFEIDPEAKITFEAPEFAQE